MPAIGHNRTKTTGTITEGGYGWALAAAHFLAQLSVCSADLVRGWRQSSHSDDNDGDLRLTKQTAKKVKEEREVAKSRLASPWHAFREHGGAARAYLDAW